MTRGRGYGQERRYRKKDKEKNLVDEDFKEMTKEFAEGNFPGPPAIKRYKHPIKNRTIKVSRGQRRGIRRRHDL